MLLNGPVEKCPALKRIFTAGIFRSAEALLPHMNVGLLPGAENPKPERASAAADPRLP